MNSRFTASAQRALRSALYISRELGHTYIGTDHILLGILSEKECIASVILENHGITEYASKKTLGVISGTGARTSVTPEDMTPRAKRLIEHASYEALRLCVQYIGTEHLLLAALDDPECSAVQLIKAQGGSAAEIISDINSFLSGMGFSETAGTFGISSSRRGMRDYISPLKNAPNLSRFGRDITLLAKHGRLDPVIGRKDEIEHAIRILSRRTKNNPCLIGEPGVGKTAVVEGLASLIASGDVPSGLAAKSIISLDIPCMIAGAKYRGEFEERMKNVMGEIAKIPDIILFVDEMHTLIGAGSAEGAVDAANIIKPALARGELQMIGATTVSEYARRIEKDPALERRFQPVMLEEPTADEAVLILKGLRDKYEIYHKVHITDEAIYAAVNLSIRYLNDRYLPDKAIDLIDEAASNVKIMRDTEPEVLFELRESCERAACEKEAAINSQDFEKAAQMRDRECEAKRAYELSKRSVDLQSRGASVGENDIAQVVTSWTGIPVSRLTEDDTERLSKLPRLLRERVIGQDDAIDAVSGAIRRSRVGISDFGRPVGSFIFAGPTGVGKTELCRALADVLFGDRNAVIKLDMSEYLEKSSVSKLIGSPPGYVGYGDGGQLTEKIRRRPYSVVVFDEIEKAHPDVWNMLLQIMEDGVLTDSQGRKASFKNAVVIMTSNAGAEKMVSKSGRLGFSDMSAEYNINELKEKAEGQIKAIFPPEFINRIDEIVVFKPLSFADVEKIAVILLDGVKDRLKKSGYTAEFSPEVIRMIAKEGTDPVYGARPIRRVIQKKIEASFADSVISGDINPGDSLFAQLSDEGDIIWKKKLSEVTCGALSESVGDQSGSGGSGEKNAVEE